jgi:hypothetical protein
MRQILASVFALLIAAPVAAQSERYELGRRLNVRNAVLTWAVLLACAFALAATFNGTLLARWADRHELGLPQPPATVQEALERLPDLRRPIAIQVRPTGQYTEIAAARFV